MSKNPKEIVKKGELYLENDKHERKSTGSYYTTDYIVKYIVQNTVGPVLEEKMEKGQKLFGEIESLRAKAKRATGAKRILAQNSLRLLDKPIRSRIFKENSSSVASRFLLLSS